LVSENLAPRFLIRGPKGEIMTVKEWAGKLNEIEYPAGEIHQLEKELKADKIIVVYGASDDLLEFEGLICEEMGAYNGGEAKIVYVPGRVISLRKRSKP
jgi:hypothetical protein